MGRTRDFIAHIGYLILHIAFHRVFIPVRRRSLHRLEHERNTMTAFNPISTMQRLEGAGFKRSQSEALATELHHATTELVTKDEMAKAHDALANKLTLRLSAVTAAMLTLAVTLSKLFA